MFLRWMNDQAGTLALVSLLQPAARGRFKNTRIGGFCASEFRTHEVIFPGGQVQTRTDVSPCSPLLSGPWENIPYLKTCFGAFDSAAFATSVS